MTAYWLAQAWVSSPSDWYHNIFNRDERRFKKQLSVYSAVIGVHFFFWAPIPLVPVPSLMPFVH